MFRNFVSVLLLAILLVFAVRQNQCDHSARREDDPFGMEKISVDFCGGNISSIKQPNTKILSTKSSGDVTAGALAVLRVEFVLRDDVRFHSHHSGCDHATPCHFRRAVND